MYISILSIFVIALPAASFPFQVILIKPGSVVTLPTGKSGVPGRVSPGVVKTFDADHNPYVPSLYFHLS